MPEAGQVTAPAGLDAGYEQLRHAVLHQRAQAFPLGLGVLIAKGVTGWHRLLTPLTGTPHAGTPPTRSDAGPPGPGPAPTPPPDPPTDPLPPQVTAQLVHALAAVAVALAGA